MTPLGSLFVNYTLSELFRLIIQTIGANGLILVAGAFFAATVYVYALPIRTAFAWGETRIAGITLVFSVYILIFLSLIIVGGNSVVASWPYFFPITFLAAIAQGSTPKWSFSDFLLFKKVTAKTWPKLIARRFAWTYLLLLATIAETLYILNGDPSLPLISWGYTVVSLGIAVLLSAFGLGFLYQISSAPYVHIEMIGEAVEGFLPVRASDHCLLVTKEKSVVVQANCIKTIFMINPPDLPG